MLLLLETQLKITGLSCQRILLLPKVKSEEKIAESKLDNYHCAVFLLLAADDI